MFATREIGFRRETSREGAMKNTMETLTSQPCGIPAMAEVNAILADYIELRELMEDFAEEDELVGAGHAAKAR
jgi:hypothetical protein